MGFWGLGCAQLKPITDAVKAEPRHEICIMRVEKQEVRQRMLQQDLAELYNVHYPTINTLSLCMSHLPCWISITISIWNMSWLELLCVSWTPNKNPASGPSDAFAVFQVIQSDTQFWMVQNQMWDFKNRVIKDGQMGKERRKQTRSCTVDTKTAFSFEFYCVF